MKVTDAQRNAAKRIKKHRAESLRISREYWNRSKN